MREGWSAPRPDQGKSMAKHMKIVRLLEPEMCLECRFAKMAQVEQPDGTVSRMIHCRRLDCDNWDSQGAEPVKDIQWDVDEAA